MKSLLRLGGATAVLVIAGGVRAQAPASLAGLVLDFKVVSMVPGQPTSTQSLWLRSDGTYATVVSSSSEAGGDVTPVSGQWSYTVTATGVGDLLLTPPGQSQIPTGPAPYTYEMTFSNATSGSIDAGPGSLTGGTFSLRPSEFQLGPTNLSTQGTLVPGVVLTSGFVLSAAQFVLLRAVGPSLTAFGIMGPASNPTLTLLQGGKVLATAAPWAATAGSQQTYQNAALLCGAFPLIPGVGDAALLIELSSGAYSVQTSSTGGGTVLLEAYFLP